MSFPSDFEWRGLAQGQDDYNRRVLERVRAEVERLRAERAELRRLLLVAYDALFFERGMTPQDRDAMRHALETIPREVTPIQTDP